AAASGSASASSGTADSCRPAACPGGTCGNRRAFSFGVRLLGRLGAVEALELHAGIEHAHCRGIGCEVAIEALGVEDLRHQTAVSHGRRLAVAELPGLALQLRFDLG